LLSYPHVSPHGRIYKAQGAPLQNDRTHYPAIYLNSPHSRSRESPCNPLHKASSPGRRVLRISKRPEPVNIVSCLSCIWHEPFCYSRRHHPTPKNTSRGNPGCAVGPKTPTMIADVLEKFGIYLHQLTPNAIVRLSIYIWALQSQGAELLAEGFCRAHELHYQTKAREDGYTRISAATILLIAKMRGLQLLAIVPNGPLAGRPSGFMLRLTRRRRSWFKAHWS
jgi:hypothetical protein